MRKIIFMAVALVILSVQSCFAAEISEAHFNDNEKLIYPVVHVSDCAIEQKINVAIIAEIDRFTTAIYRNAQVNGYEVGDIHTSYEIPCNQAGNTVILSVLLTESSYYMKAAHPSTYLCAMNFNLSNGELIGIDYLTDVGEGVPVSHFVDRLNKKLVEKAEREKLYLFPDALPVKELPENFYWDENLHVHFIFQHYAVAPYAMGIIDVDIDA